MKLSWCQLRRRVGTAIILMVVCALPQAAPGERRSAPSVLVVTSRDDGPYAEVASGIRNTLNGRAGRRSVEILSLLTDGQQALERLQQARLSGTTPLITIGSTATRSAIEAPGDGATIACMALDPSDFRSARNMTGVLLEFPLETQLKWIQRFLPATQSIGVLYNAAENRHRIEQAREVAQRLGMRLVAREVNRPQDLPDALSSVAREADLLWAVTDRIVLSQKTAEAVLLFSFRNRMPFTGLSSSWVKAGALYALDRDYEDLGSQCAEMALQVAAGRRADAIAPTTPRTITYVVNLRTAEHLKMDFPPDLIEGAAEVFR